MSADNVEKKLEARGSVQIVADHASRVDIAHLKCAKAEIVVTYSSTVVIDKIECQEVRVIVEHAGTLKLLGGHVDAIGGRISHASTGIHKNTTILRDNVEVGPACYWGAGWLAMSAGANQR